MFARPMMILGTVFVVTACQRSDSIQGDSAAVAVDPATGRGSGSAGTAAATCGVDARTNLSGEGIGDLRVGAPVESVRQSCRVVRDTTVAGPEGMQERRLVVDLGRDSVIAVVDSNRVWRVHVASPAFRTGDSLGVGTPASVLRERTGAKVLVGEGKIFVTLPSHCGLSFRLRGVQFGRVTRPEQIPAGASVDEVLAIGCRRGSG